MEGAMGGSGRRRKCGQGRVGELFFASFASVSFDVLMRVSTQQQLLYQSDLIRNRICICIVIL
jgi:hypothetical protein